MDVQLVMFTNKGDRRDFEVKREAVILGRSGDCHFQIPLADVSRRHCKLVWKNNKLYVKDMGSSNGTFVNNKRVLQSEVQPGDLLRIGPVVFTVVINGAPTEIKPVKTVINQEGTSMKEGTGQTGAGEGSVTSVESLLDSSILPVDSTAGASAAPASSESNAPTVGSGDVAADLDALPLEGGATGEVELDSSDSASPLAELEELAKQRKK